MSHASHAVAIFTAIIGRMRDKALAAFVLFTGGVVALGLALAFPERGAHSVPGSLWLTPREPLSQAPTTGRKPSAGVSCAQARSVIRQARAELALEPPDVHPEALANGTADWLDPHGLWSAAPDAPIGARIQTLAPRLLEELEGRAALGCPTAAVVGTYLTGWTAHLRQLFHASYEEARQSPRDDVLSAASASVFPSGDVIDPALTLSVKLGRILGQLSRDPHLLPYVETTTRRLFPEHDANDWQGLVLAAALRAYIPLIDSHGAWAPVDEEASIYDVDLETDPPPRLWRSATRTAIGVLIDDPLSERLSTGDVVLSIEQEVLGGLSVERLEELNLMPVGRRTKITILRRSTQHPIDVLIDPQAPRRATEPRDADEQLRSIAYGQGTVVVLHLDDIAETLPATIEAATTHVLQTAAAGLVLDLRGNGGGSADAAIEALGYFLPGAPLFPMKRRDGWLEVERAPDLVESKRYAGPLAVLVDGRSASAAEMIAGAIGAYHRGPVIGARTFGKGCAQEYLQDPERSGVLRLTTLVFSLPDGSPLQRTGVTPSHFLDIPGPALRESSLRATTESWRGPDVRAGTFGPVEWPSHGGHVGRCSDPDLCRALRVLGASRSASL